MQVVKVEKLNLFYKPEDLNQNKMNNVKNVSISKIISIMENTCIKERAFIKVTK